MPVAVERDSVLLKLIKTQLRVIHTLALREIQTQQANFAYGFGWVFFDAFLGIASLMVMKFVIRGFNRPGVPPFTFLVSGIVPWMLFSTTYASPAGAIAKGKSMLQLPMVTELDLVLATTLRIFTVYAIFFFILGVISTSVDGIPPPEFPLGIVLLFFCMSLMGTVFGVFLMAINRVYAPASKFLNFPLRVMMLVSGVVFSLTMFPTYMWPYLLWNPFLHIEELIRTYWFNNYETPGISAYYVAKSLLAMVFFGLLLERYLRRRSRA